MNLKSDVVNKMWWF